MSNTSTKNNDTFVVIGVDFGTTYSGVAWYAQTAGSTISSSRSDNFITVNTWPGGASDLQRSAGQVPSVISYYNRNTRYKWGFEVEQNGPERSQYHAQLSWFKLLLNQKPTGSIMDSDLNSNDETGALSDRHKELLIAERELNDRLRTTMELIPKGKTIVDITADYLKELVVHTDIAFQQTYPSTVYNRMGNEIPVQYVLTVPAIWSDQAKALTLEAAERAGMRGKDGSKRSVRLITEPEAAALHCLSFYKDSVDSLKVGEIYVIADCGGGTVDLISYEITAVEPTLKMKECVAGTGAMCGSTALNRRFMSYLKYKLGPVLWSKLTPRMLQQVENHFEFLKRGYMPPSAEEDDFKLDDDDDDEDFENNTFDIFIPLPGMPDDKSRSLEGGYLELTHTEMKRIFEPTFHLITELIREQIECAEKRSKIDVKGVLLVGGFGESKYLRQHLATKLQEEEGRDIEILQPNKAWSAIVLGAVHDGVAHHMNAKEGRVNSNGMVESRCARFSYGTPVSRQFIPGVHPIENRILDPQRCIFLCYGLMSWFIKKNEDLPCDEPIKLPMAFDVDTEPSYSDLVIMEKIFICDSEDPPELQKDPGVYKLLEFKSDFNSVKQCLQKRKSPLFDFEYNTLSFDSVLRYGSAGLVFSIEKDGKEIGVSPVVKYEHDVPNSMRSRGEGRGEGEASGN